MRRSNQTHRDASPTFEENGRCALFEFRVIVCPPVGGLRSAPTNEELNLTPDRHLQVDAWGDTVSYRLQDSGFQLRSAGPDRVMGSEDDIVEAPDSPSGP